MTQAFSCLHLLMGEAGSPAYKACANLVRSICLASECCRPGSIISTRSKIALALLPS
jgi:hypothetical protein